MNQEDNMAEPPEDPVEPEEEPDEDSPDEPDEANKTFQLMGKVDAKIRVLIRRKLKAERQLAAAEQERLDLVSRYTELLKKS